jgi:hypothetical protein
MKLNSLKVRIKRMFIKVAFTLVDTGGEMNMEFIKSMLPKKGTAGQESQPTVITIGKIHYVVNEHFAENGKELDELMEKLVVDKFRKIL